MPHFPNAAVAYPADLSVAGSVVMPVGNGNCSRSPTSPLSRAVAWPGFRPVISTVREGAQTALPQ